MSKRVLIIEDDGFLQGLEAGKLEKEGYEVVTASSGAEAMKKIHEPNIDVILLDLMLPDYDGFELLQNIRKIEVLKNVPVIVFSNLSEEKDVARSKELGATDFMVKSNFTLEELIENVKKLK